MKNKKFGAWTLLLIFLAVILGSVIYYNRSISPLVKDLAEAEIKKKTVDAVVSGALKLKVYEVFYGDFYEYEKNKDGEIVLVRSNTASINAMNVYAQKEIQNSINSLKNDKISIPAGAFTGSSWLADKGDGIELNVLPVGAVETKLNSYFYHEGLNQTIHRLVLKVTTTVKVIVPVKAEDVSVSLEFLLAEDLIQGRVPDSYVTGISDDNIYDLLP
ncbi:MAG: sporulation protein YunB [Clostridia bacterium]|nr:sporulation protein YunB [Clostridia bacterium]